MREQDFFPFISQLLKRSPSAEAIAEARSRVIDSLACFYGAADLPALRRLNQAFFDSSKGPCSRWGTLLSAPPERSVLQNGAGVRALDYNDTYLSKEPCHPSDTLAALWAAAELAGGAHQGRRVLTAMVRSYEVMVRLCDAASLRSRGWDHVTYLPIAAAVGAASVFNLSDEKTKQAVALALIGSVALRQTRVGTISDWKAACAANASRAGLVGALLARAGFTGPSDIFSGRHGFERQVSGPIRFDKRRLGQPWGILRTHLKYFPAEHHSQSAIEAAQEIRSQLMPSSGRWPPSPRGRRDATTGMEIFSNVSPLPLGEDRVRVESILVDSFEAAVTIIGSEKEKWAPTTRETADHSLPYLIAVALLDGDVTLGQYERKRYLDSDVRSLMKKIKIRRDPRYDRMYPKVMPARLTVTLSEGTKLSEEVILPKGYAGRPFEPIDLKNKFGRLARRVMSQSRVDFLWTRLSRFEQIERLSNLRAPMNIS